MTPTDDELIAAARAGDDDAIETLLARYETQIYRFALRLCGHEADARDVLQETMIAALRGLPGFRGEARLSTWLYMIARSFCIKQRRPGASVPTGAPLPDTEAAPAADLEDQVHARQIGRALAAAMSALPEAHREAVVLRDVEGLSAEEAAEVAGVEIGALKSRLHRGRKELREHLAILLGEAITGDTAPCPELAQDLAAYAASDIDQATCAQVEAHLARCPRCAGACDQLKRTVALCRRIPGDGVPPEVKSAVRHALHAAIGAGPA